MFLRNAFDITALVRQQNALAVLVNPPNPPGTPGDNGGNLNDPNIGENVTMRYTVGWDWVMPIPDRNRGSGMR
jgi:mannosylglycoprotein endo-beta-mannosidase